MRRLFFAIVFFVVIIAAVLPVSASIPLFEDNPVRPVNSSRLEATVGIVLGYKVHIASNILSLRLTVYDKILKKVRTFSLSYRTQVNGVVMQCNDFSDNTVDNLLWPADHVAHQNHLCKHLPPGIILGRTQVVLIYWKYNYATAIKKAGGILNTLDRHPRSDAMWIVPGGSAP